MYSKTNLFTITFKNIDRLEYYNMLDFLHKNKNNPFDNWHSSCISDEYSFHFKNEMDMFLFCMKYEYCHD